MHGEFVLLKNLSVSLVLALVFGFITQKLRLSPIVGYLLAGVAIGPWTPGFVANPALAAELAEIGVVLLMFGVGLHFDLKDLLAVRRVSVPGAVVQILVATVLGLSAALAAGFGFGAGLVIGIAVSIASTVVLMRVLMDNDSLQTTQGHIAVGWLIVQDIFTVMILVILPVLAGTLGARPAVEEQNLFVALGLAVLKVTALALIVVAGGRYVIPWLLRQVASTRSRELFTLTILAIALAVATGSAVGFGVSMALGAFLAGMVVGQTEVSHQAAADALPMRDAFAVLFFVSVGILFDPTVLANRPGLLVGLLGIVFLVNPLVAFVVIWLLRYSVRSALTVAIGLSQIGEFSFLLADEALRLELLPPEGRSLLVACALISITVNPLLFRAIGPLEVWLRGRPKLWRALSQRSEAGGAELNVLTRTLLQQEAADDEQEGKPKPVSAVIIGYGPVGQTASRVLKQFGVRPVVIDLNLDTIRGLADAGERAVYGDATRRDILEVAGITQAKYLLVTIPDVLVRTVVILAARDLNEKIRVFARARYLKERAWLEEVGADAVVTEEGETAIGLAAMLLKEVGADEDRVREEIRKIHDELRAPQETAERE
jgi:monovalent cation:H+ antiporter-2, CPA2 family